MILQIFCVMKNMTKQLWKWLITFSSHPIWKNYYINLFILYYQKRPFSKVVISFHYQFVAFCFHFCNLGNSEFHLLVGEKRFEQLEISATTRNGL